MIDITLLTQSLVPSTLTIGLAKKTAGTSSFTVLLATFVPVVHLPVEAVVWASLEYMTVPNMDIPPCFHQYTLLDNISILIKVIVDELIGQSSAELDLGGQNIKFGVGTSI